MEPFSKNSFFNSEKSSTFMYSLKELLLFLFKPVEYIRSVNCNLSNDIKELSTKIRTMEAEHKTAIDKLSEQLDKIFSHFPYIKELLRWGNFLRSIGLPDDMVRRLFNKETVVASG